MYQIKNISELNTIDFTDLDQLPNTVRKSVDGSKFIISGESLTEGYTSEEILTIVETEEWTNPNPFINI